MFSQFLKLFHSNPLEPTSELEIPRYPPFLKGLPACQVLTICQTQRPILGQIREVVGFPNFKAYLKPAIDAYAQFVQLVPASEAHHHRGAGGLFRHGLEVCYYAGRLASAKDFSDRDQPRVIAKGEEQRWLLAAMLAGLLHDVGKVINDIRLTDLSGRYIWNPHSETLSRWLERHKIDHYFVHYQKRQHGVHELHSALLVDRMLGANTRAFLTLNSPNIMSSLLDAVSTGQMRTPLSEIVLRADQQSVEQDIAKQPLDPESLSIAVPIERYLIDALVQLSKAQWQRQINTGLSPLVYLDTYPENLVLNWPKVARAITLHLTTAKIPGIPQDPDKLSDLLASHGYLIYQQRNGQNHKYVQVQFETKGFGKLTWKKAVVLKNPYILLTALPEMLVNLVPAEQTTNGQANSAVDATAHQPKSKPSNSTDKNIQNTAPETHSQTTETNPNPIQQPDRPNTEPFAIRSLTPGNAKVESATGSWQNPTRPSATKQNMPPLDNAIPGIEPALEQDLKPLPGILVTLLSHIRNHSEVLGGELVRLTTGALMIHADVFDRLPSQEYDQLMAVTEESTGLRQAPLAGRMVKAELQPMLTRALQSVLRIRDDELNDNALKTELRIARRHSKNRQDRNKTLSPGAGENASDVAQQCFGRKTKVAPPRLPASAPALPTGKGKPATITSDSDVLIAAPQKKRPESFKRQSNNNTIEKPYGRDPITTAPSDREPNQEGNAMPNDPAGVTDRTGSDALLAISKWIHSELTGHSRLWYFHPITYVAGHWVSDGQTLDRICSRYPGVSKNALKAYLRTHYKISTKQGALSIAAPNEAS